MDSDQILDCSTGIDMIDIVYSDQLLDAARHIHLYIIMISYLHKLKNNQKMLEAVL